MKMKTKLLTLKPTQFAVGMLEVDEKIKEFEALSKGKKKKEIRAREIPVVISPHNELYLVDHHHWAFVCWHANVEKVPVKVLADLSKSKMSFAAFWSWMRKHGYLYPYCQFGEGPRNALYLPNDIRGVADDPYRSLAWFVRQAGGYKNSDKTFAEFRWANFFRSKKLLDRHGKLGFELAVKKALKWAAHPSAARLPGYIKPKVKAAKIKKSDKKSSK